MSYNWKEELICNPIDTYDEIELFLENPPPWRTLCKELTPHSKYKLKNSELQLNKHYTTTLESPETFCHVNLDEEVNIHHEAANLPKTLVCHDMKNGYLADSYIDGTAEYDAYTFYNWAGIDIFCYFSHHLITIPPLGWINVGHDHGVKVIGTVISEWAEGVKFWDKILSSQQEYMKFANSLVTITKTLKFDGWLLNVENKISKPDELLDFVRYLHSMLHQEIPNAVLIWYDSVTTEGSLNWQNGLNEKNWGFFDACDGLFTNYSWILKDLENSAEIARTGDPARDRRTDLYIGIDVWGRNFYGGGQFNTQEAVKLVHSYECSLAIFAPAWTHEAMTTDKLDINAVAVAEGLDQWHQFLLRDRALWGSLWPFLYTRPLSVLPFKTSFCRGLGRKRRIYGEVLSNCPWYNLRHQQYQPNSAHGPHGYLLSTQAAILIHATQAVSGTGILRYPYSFKTSRHDLHSATFQESADPPSEDSHESIDKNRDNNENEDKQATHKTSFIERLKSVWSSKSVSYLNVVEEGEPEPGPSLERESSTPDIERVKMPSINLRLGQKGHRRRLALASVPEERECLELYLEDSFHGGACLRINPCDELSPEHRLTRLFHCDLHCEGSLVVCMVTKTLPGHREQYLNLKLFMKGPNAEDLRVVLIGHHCPPAAVHARPAVEGVRIMPPLDAAADAVDDAFRTVQHYLLLNQADFYVPVENSFGWVVRYYEVVDVAGYHLTSINCRTGLEQGPVLLGHIALCHRPIPPSPSPAPVPVPLPQQEPTDNEIV